MPNLLLQMILMQETGMAAANGSFPILLLLSFLLLDTYGVLLESVSLQPAKSLMLSK